VKGIIFREFLDLVEDKFGLETVDEIIQKSDLKSEGAYTTTGTYDFSEMLQLITNLSEKTSISVDDLLLIYGEHLFGVFKKKYPEMINAYRDPIELLSSIENHIHVEVIKLYPDAELPTFSILEKTSDTLVMLYKSDRALHKLGLGLMKQTFNHFQTKVNIFTEVIKPDGTEVKFEMKIIDGSKSN
jgi:hypothetical protein